MQTHVVAQGPVLSSEPCKQNVQGLLSVSPREAALLDGKEDHASPSSRQSLQKKPGRDVRIEARVSPTEEWDLSWNSSVDMLQEEKNLTLLQYSL